MSEYKKNRNLINREAKKAKEEKPMTKRTRVLNNFFENTKIKPLHLEE